MNLTQKKFVTPMFLSSTEDSDFSAFSDIVEPKTKPAYPDECPGFIPRAGGLVKNFVNTLSLGKSESIRELNYNRVTPRISRTDVSDSRNKAMIRKGSPIDTDSEGETEPKARLNSLIGIMVSTIMCLAAKCPIPKPNIQATKLFLSTIVNDSGETPRNIKGLLTLLKNYHGPYEGDTTKQVKYERHPPLTVAPPVAKQRETIRVSASGIRSRLPSQTPAKRSVDQRKQS